jgi:hypothetical protein
MSMSAMAGERVRGQPHDAAGRMHCECGSRRARVYGEFGDGLGCLCYVFSRRERLRAFAWARPNLSEVDMLGLAFYFQ